MKYYKPTSNVETIKDYWVLALVCTALANKIEAYRHFAILSAHANRLFEELAYAKSGAKKAEVLAKVSTLLEGLMNSAMMSEADAQWRLDAIVADDNTVMEHIGHPAAMLEPQAGR